MTGLVLAGGGAKGAYQIGAWRALRERGVKFDVIFGTSIGALNAALVASDDLDKALTFWRSLSIARLARIEPLLLVGLALRLVSLLIPGANFSRTHASRELCKRLKYAPIVAVSFALLLGIPMILLSMPLSIVLPLGLFNLFFAIILFLPDLAELVNGALVSRGVLSRLVDESVDWKKVAAGHPSVVVTTARSVRDPRFRKLTEAVPDYMSLGALKASDARACLIASMSLPFGIFPHVEIAGVRCMDGGIADNIPIFPALLADCSVIYVVHLSPKPRYRGYDLLDDEQLDSAMHWIDNVRRKAGEPPLYGQKWFEQRFKIVNDMQRSGIAKSDIQAYLEEISDSPGAGGVKIVHIVPQRRLGRGLLGTLIFRRAKTERLLATGYEDAKATLAGSRSRPASRPNWRERREWGNLLLEILIKIVFLLLMLLGIWWLTRS